MATATDWVSTVTLTVIGLAAGVNVARGTFRPWVRAKFLLDAPPPVVSIADTGGGQTLPPLTPIPGTNPNPGAGGGRYADPLPSGALISGWGACRTGLTCTGSCCRRHKGIDLGAPAGTPVYSIAPGRVSAAGPGSGGCGLRATVAHDDGTRAVYCHLSSVLARPGQRLAGAGIPLGGVGTTGNATGTTPHLHFEIHQGGRAVDPTRLIGR